MVPKRQNLKNMTVAGFEPGTTRYRNHGHTTRPRELRQQLGSGVGLVQSSLSRSQPSVRGFFLHFGNFLQTFYYLRLLYMRTISLPRPLRSASKCLGGGLEIRESRLTTVLTDRLRTVGGSSGVLG